MSDKLIIPKEYIDDISKLVKLSEKQLQELYDILNLKYAKDEEGVVLVTEIANRLGLTIKDSIDLIRVLYNLTNQKEDFELEDGTFIEELKKEFVDKQKGRPLQEVRHIDKKQQLILKLFGPKPNAEHLEKVNFLKTGLIKTASHFRSFCDIRPAFNKEKTKIKGLIPVTIMEVGFENDDNVVFQLNEESFKKLKTFVDETSGKLKIINNLIEKNSKNLEVE